MYIILFNNLVIYTQETIALIELFQTNEMTLM